MFAAFTNECCLRLKRKYFSKPFGFKLLINQLVINNEVKSFRLSSYQFLKKGHNVSYACQLTLDKEIRLFDQ